MTKPHGRGGGRPSRGAVLEFLGATGTVTGSRFLVSTPRARVLVDCGLYQGPKELRERNWKPLPVDPASIDAVLLTHAHVDHSGYLPRLVTEGFRGRIYASARSVELAGIILPDCGYLQEEEARYANAAGYSKHSPALPLYTQEDAAATLERLAPIDFAAPTEVAAGIAAVFRPAGHILGSASVQVISEGDERSSITFSGDLGRSQHPLLLPPEPPPEAATLVIESTYGDREHPEEAPEEQLAQVILRTFERGGVAVIPAFAVDRTEVILFHLKKLTDAGRLPEFPVYVDSPMALASLGVYRRAIADGDAEVRPELRGRRDVFRPEGLIEARDVADSKAIHDVDGPALIVSASGMATGGRVLHHLARRLPDARNSVAFVGFQPTGTRGRQLIEGAREVKLLGRHVPVRAEVADLGSFSVHADQRELLAWLTRARSEPDTVYVVHGEPAPAAALRQAIEERLQWCAVVARYRERVLTTARDATRR